MTGESVPVDKSVAPTATEAPLSDRTSMAFSGTFVTSAEWLERPGTVGKPPTPDHVGILDPVSGDPLPPGEVGTVYLKAPDVGRFEYYGDPVKTAGSYHGDHFTMGDVGYLDEAGYLFLTDRSADLIISGGVNVYPAEVEAALLAHPDVGERIQGRVLAPLSHGRMAALARDLGRPVWAPDAIPQSVEQDCLRASAR